MSCAFKMQFKKMRLKWGGNSDPKRCRDRYIYSDAKI